jgi:hypothetical protein
MKAQAYHFEIKDLITQFVAAFDNIVIRRYNADRSVDSQVHVRYVYSPKQRVMFDLVNKAQNITVPVVSVSISSINRSAERVFNKIHGFYYGQYATSSAHVRTPVPVDISVNVSILAKFQTDMDQILSNFVPYNNPYIIISWKVPSDFGLPTDLEIRSEVLWSGSVTMSYPTELNATDKYKITADTSFTIKGWLFPDTSNAVGNIYYVNSNFFNEASITDYDSLSGQTWTYPTSAGVYNELETVAISGNPDTGKSLTQTLTYPMSAPLVYSLGYNLQFAWNHPFVTPDVWQIYSYNAGNWTYEESVSGSTLSATALLSGGAYAIQGTDSNGTPITLKSNIVYPV